MSRPFFLSFLFLALLASCAEPPERHLRDLDLWRIRLGTLAPQSLVQENLTAQLAFARGIGDTVFLRITEIDSAACLPDVLQKAMLRTQQVDCKGRFRFEWSVFRYRSFPATEASILIQNFPK